MTETHLVIKISDAERYLSPQEMGDLGFIADKICQGRKKAHLPTHEYIVVNMDEPYADDVLTLVEIEEKKKSQTPQK